eukprot:771336-Rhodomonas_salina.1
MAAVVSLPTASKVAESAVNERDSAGSPRQKCLVGDLLQVPASHDMFNRARGCGRCPERLKRCGAGVASARLEPPKITSICTQ